VDWAGFFDLPGRPPAQRAKKLDGRLCSSIMHLPRAITGDVEVEAFHSLAARDLQRDGDRLGEVGGRIAGEVLVGLLDHDPGSFRASRPDWRPELPSRVAGTFTMADLLGFLDPRLGGSTDAIARGPEA
jgi:hypothetical protein